jgi:hypothetical protein
MNTTLIQSILFATCSMVTFDGPGNPYLIGG